MKYNIGNITLLSSMTFFQFFTQGTWSMTLGLVLENNHMASNIKTAFFLLGVATIVSPLAVGYISDKISSPKAILAALYLLNGLNFIFLYISFHYGNVNLVMGIVFLTGILFYPTISLVNSITFQNVSNEKLFPIIRSFGTLGFIFSGFFIGYYEIEDNHTLYLVASVFSVLMALISISGNLKLNVRRKNVKDGFILGLRSVWYSIKKGNSVVIITCALLLMISQVSYSAYIPIYLRHLGFKSPTSIMQLAVISELFLILSLSLLLDKFKLKNILIFGALAYFMRNILIVSAEVYDFTVLIVVALIIQGVSWVFFFITIDILFKNISSDKNNHQMQGFKVFFINGIGYSFASLVCGVAYNNWVGVEVTEGWVYFWSIPLVTSIFSFGILIFTVKHRG
ncbi:MFS transporter [Serratia fonticola]|uniref:MFS transporter n=1 Tax=Serratia fonticola TaxID=47917 RepID=UPI0015C66F28|nr:MFS transporter [Serratia fonticola]NXZ88690.1 MFS transporter [Serratia fonticola]NYA43688.1 MFS transporter [Serratia fonticola]